MSSCHCVPYVEEAARTIGRTINSYRVVVNKSTVPIGAGRLVKKWIAKELAARALTQDFDVVSNPKFLREVPALAIVKKLVSCDVYATEAEIDDLENTVQYQSINW